jgi:hypothetical protein
MTEPYYPHNLNHLARYINQPLFPIALCQFLFHHNHSDLEQAPANIKDLPSFEGEIKVYHSAITTYYAPSDLCGAGGLHREFIRSTPSFRRDTVFVVLDESKKGMEGMEIAQGAHLLPIYGFSWVPDDFSHHDTLDMLDFKTFKAKRSTV